MQIYKPIMFDLDGTLFRVDLVSVPAFEAAFAQLRARGLWAETPPREKMLQVYGMTAAELWPFLLPGASERIIHLAQEVSHDVEMEYLRQGKGRLFDRVRETLAALDERGHQLFVVSNGAHDYVRAVCDIYGLDQMMAGIYCAGEYKTKRKSELLARAIADHGLSPGWMVGDRVSDIEAGRENGFITVACTYGYGSRQELAEADNTIDCISQVTGITQQGDLQ